MKIQKIILILGISILFHFNLFAQERIKFIISSGNYAYAGIKNQLTYKSFNTDRNNLIFKCDNGTIENNSGKLIFKTSYVGATDIIVFSKIGKDIVKQYQQKIIVRKVPVPTVMINGNFIEGTKNKSIFMNAISLDGHIDDIQTLDYIVTSFNLIIKESQTSKEYLSSSNLLTSEMKIALATIKSGDRLFFYNVSLKGDDNTSRILDKIIEVNIE
jgi:hypothetical protein